VAQADEISDVCELVTTEADVKLLEADAHCSYPTSLEMMQHLALQ